MSNNNSLKNIARLITAEKESLAPENSFLNDLERSIEITAQKNRRKPSQSYHPSGMNCIRQSYYEITGATPDDRTEGYSLIGICNSGTDTHVRIQTAVSQMKDNGMDCEYLDVGKFVKDNKIKDIQVKSQDGMETKLFHKKLNISFMCDGIIRYKGKEYILELKTENSSKFFMREGVDPSHFHQATAYSICLGLDEVLFVYISRDTLDMKSYMYKVTEDMKYNMIGYIDECDSYIKKLKVPPKPAEVARKTCSYCSYRSLCMSEA